ncbi:MAG: hypothetical protein EXR27_10765 [Betaproteobacteria bacterium]|nr:hypothetical protein [Betaproteobacteria bacterium]
MKKSIKLAVRILFPALIIAGSLTNSSRAQNASPTWTIPTGVSTKVVNDYPLAYTERGSGPTIVFVHGILSDHRYWQAPLEAWTADFRILAVSLRHFYP